MNFSIILFLQNLCSKDHSGQQLRLVCLTNSLKKCDFLEVYEGENFSMQHGKCIKLLRVYHVSCEPLRIFWDDDITCSTWVSCMLSTTGWIPGFSACSGQHAWHSCRAGCIAFSENPQGLATHMVCLTSGSRVKTAKEINSVFKIKDSGGLLMSKLSAEILHSDLGCVLSNTTCLV